MSKKSLVSLQKGIIRDGHVSTRERVKTLRMMERPSERFLRAILDLPDAPDELRRAAASRLVSLLAKPRSEPEPVPRPTATPKTPEEQHETAIEETGVEVIPAEIWDLLGGVPGAVRGPDPLPGTAR